MGVKLQGKTLAAATTEAIAAIEERELREAKREVAVLVERINADLKHETSCLKSARKTVEDINERISKLQQQLKALKAGDQSAVKMPDSVSAVTGRWTTPRYMRHVVDFETANYIDAVNGIAEMRKFRGF